MTIQIHSAAKIVFSRRIYVIIAVAVSTALWILLNMFDQNLFFSPMFTFYLPSRSIAGFVITNITVVLLGIIVPMNIYALKHSNSRPGATFLSGTFTGVAPSVCVGCSSIGFFLASTLGTVGTTLSSFLANYDIPLRMGAIGLLIFAYYSVNRKITSACIRPSKS